MKTVDEYYHDIEPLIENGWYQAAICAFDQLLETNPDFARGHFEVGTLHFKVGEKDKALECYEKAVEYDPGNTDYLKSLADFYHAELEQIEPALNTYKKVIAQDHNDVETLFIAANLSVAAHNFDDAVKYYQKVLEVEPWHAEAFEYLEKIKAHQNSETEQASPEELYQQSKQAGTNGDIEKAVSILEMIVSNVPDYAVAHNDLGVYYQKLGDREKSLQHLGKAVRFEPYNNMFKKNLADFLYVVKGEVSQALKIYLTVLENDPEDTEVLMAAGHISAAVNKPRNAEVFYRRVLDIEPWNLEASQGLEKLSEDPAGKIAGGF